MNKSQMPTIMMLALIWSLSIRAADNSKDLLNQSSFHFSKGQYQKTLDLMSNIDIRNGLDNSDDMKTAFKIKAISYAQLQKIDLAKETIRELLYLDPNYSFDPFDTPTAVLELSQQEKLALDEKNLAIATIKNNAQMEGTLGPSNLAVPGAITARRTAPAMINNFLPFGINLFSLGSPVRGGIYLSVQTLGLLTNVSAFWWKQSYLKSFGSNQLERENMSGRFETAQMIQYIGLGSLILGYGLSVLDSLLRSRKLYPLDD